jgi:hypothetical protein
VHVQLIGIKQKTKQNKTKQKKKNQKPKTKNKVVHAASLIQLSQINLYQFQICTCCHKLSYMCETYIRTTYIYIIMKYDFLSTFHTTKNTIILCGREL